MNRIINICFLTLLICYEGDSKSYEKITSKTQSYLNEFEKRQNRPLVFENTASSSNYEIKTELSLKYIDGELYYIFKILNLKNTSSNNLSDWDAVDDIKAFKLSLKDEDSFTLHEFSITNEDDSFTTNKNDNKIEYLLKESSFKFSKNKYKLIDSYELFFDGTIYINLEEEYTQLDEKLLSKKGIDVKDRESINPADLFTQEEIEVIQLGLFKTQGYLYSDTDTYIKFLDDKISNYNLDLLSNEVFSKDYNNLDDLEKIAIISGVSQNVYGFLSTKSQIDMQLNALELQKSNSND